MQVLLRLGRPRTSPALQAYLHQHPSRRGQSPQLQAHLLSHLHPEAILLHLKVCHIETVILRQVRSAPDLPHLQARVPLLVVRKPHKPPGQALDRRLLQFLLHRLLQAYLILQLPSNPHPESILLGS